MGGGTGDRGGGGTVPTIFLTFNIMPMGMGVAWKESTSNGPRPPQSSRRGAALDLWINTSEAEGLNWFTHLAGFPHLLGENWDRKEQNRRNTHGTLNEKTRQPGIHDQNTNTAGK